MPFNSLAYLVFLPAVFLAHAVAGERLRGPLLLVASVLFYAALGAPSLLAALAVVVTVSYAAGLGVGAAAEGSVRRSALFWAGVLANLGVLIGFRCAHLLEGPQQVWSAAGVSFFVFQAVAYLADVHVGVLDPERHLGLFSLSLAFFPKLLQGPIEQSGPLLAQLRAPYRFDYDEVRTGLLLFGRGLFKKVVVAQVLARYVDLAYGSISSSSGLALLLATYAYALEILFDFAGYTDMALGSARLFGIRLTQNFDAPYSAASIPDFWRRWHISFSRWLLDYVFKPLHLHWRGRGTPGTAAALLVTFLVSGVWHGASWGFVVWGLLHGVYMVVSVIWQPYARKLHRALHVEGTWPLALSRRIVTFHLVCLAWVFFRAPSAGEALEVLRRIAGASGHLAFDSGRALVATILAALVASKVLDRSISTTGRSRALEWPMAVRWGTYAFFAYYLVLAYAPTKSFIYMGF